MKRRFFGSVLCAFVAGGVFAQTPEQIFERANDAYQQGNLAEARDMYESILDNGYQSGELFYNLGNTYYKLGNIGKAILHYERALRIIPRDEDLRHNLQLANLMVTDRIDPAPRLFVWDYWDSIKDFFSLNTLTWLMYLFFVIVIAAAWAVLVTRDFAGRKIGILGGSLSMGLLLVFFTLFLGKLSDIEQDDAAIVTVSITMIKNSPDPRSTDAFVLHRGVKVWITDKVNEWIKIRLADGKVGWMEISSAETI